MKGFLLPEERIELLHQPCKTAAQVSEQQVGFESGLAHLQITDSF